MSVADATKEADDIIADLALGASASGKQVTIVSSDKDFLQLIDGCISVYSPIKKTLYTKENITEELEVLPQNYNIVKALLGDNSDNLTGVKGLGLKTLIKETWTTDIEKDINLNEEFHFNGFYGQYEGTITVGNKLYKFSFDHKKENEDVIKIKLQG